MAMQHENPPPHKCSHNGLPPPKKHDNISCASNGRARSSQDMNGLGGDKKVYYGEEHLIIKAIISTKMGAQCNALFPGWPVVEETPAGSGPKPHTCTPGKAGNYAGQSPPPPPELGEPDKEKTLLWTMHSYLWGIASSYS